jgi:hypothetical protein
MLQLQLLKGRTKGKGRGERKRKVSRLFLVVADEEKPNH